VQKRFESEETIQKILGLDLVKARHLRNIVKQPFRFIDENEIPLASWFPKSRKWALACINAPRLIEVQEQMINELLDTHGIEALSSEREWRPFYCDIIYTYCNQGDPYTPTVILDCRNERFFIGCWGDIIEKEIHED
jgi:hypothetical protein